MKNTKNTKNTKGKAVVMKIEGFSFVFIITQDRVYSALSL